MKSELVVTGIFLSVIINAKVTYDNDLIMKDNLTKSKIETGKRLIFRKMDTEMIILKLCSSGRRVSGRMNCNVRHYQQHIKRILEVCGLKGCDDDGISEIKLKCQNSSFKSCFMRYRGNKLIRRGK